MSKHSTENVRYCGGGYNKVNARKKIPRNEEKGKIKENRKSICILNAMKRKRVVFEKKREKTNLKSQMIAKHKRKSESDYCMPWGSVL